jgi:hypothetical protein
MFGNFMVKKKYLASKLFHDFNVCCNSVLSAISFSRMF